MGCPGDALMSRKIAIIDGNPDCDGVRYDHAITRAYAAAAEEAGHEISHIRLAEADFPLLRSKQDWEKGTPCPFIHDCQAMIGNADHLLIAYPLWLGCMPALLKAFFEQALRPGFAIAPGERSLSPGLLHGKSARIIVTMGMPATVYRFYFRAHSLKSLERNILRFCGIGPIRRTLIGSVEAIGQEKRRAWLSHVAELGKIAA